MYLLEKNSKFAHLNLILGYLWLNRGNRFYQNWFPVKLTEKLINQNISFFKRFFPSTFWCLRTNNIYLTTFHSKFKQQKISFQPC